MITVRDEPRTVNPSFVFNRLFYLIESSDSLEGRFLLLTLPCHAMKVLRRWRISARDAKSRPVPSPDLINWLETGGEKTPLFAPRNSESVRQSSSNISPNISGLSEATTVLSPVPPWYFGFKQGISIVCLIDWGGIVLLT